MGRRKARKFKRAAVRKYVYKDNSRPNWTGTKILDESLTIGRRRSGIGTAVTTAPRSNMATPLYAVPSIRPAKKVTWIQSPRRVAARAVRLLKRDNLIIAKTKDATTVCEARKARRKMMHVTGRAGGPTRPPNFTQNSLIKCRRK